MTAGSFAAVFAAGVLDDPGIVGADRIPLPASLNGVSVTVDGLPAPILALANVNGVEQVNFQVPFEIAGLAAASVTVARDGAASAAAGVPVLELQPAVYTSDGVRAIVVHAADYTLVTDERPLVRRRVRLRVRHGSRPRDEPAGDRKRRADLPASHSPGRPAGELWRV